MEPLVSLCMIVKNEEAHLPLCLGTVADLVQEIVIVDTGSSDQTKARAAKFGTASLTSPGTIISPPRE